MKKLISPSNKYQCLMNKEEDYQHLSISDDILEVNHNGVPGAAKVYTNTDGTK
ncbi:hypothetical protein ACF0H5_006258 [Mactra antiquata]